MTAAEEGHNSSAIAANELRSLIERVERLTEEAEAINADKAEVFSEAKSRGFDPKIMKQVIKLRRMDRDDRQEQEAVLALYLEALGEKPPGLIHTRARTREETPAPPVERPR